MRQLFQSSTPFTISAQGRSVVRSALEVTGFGGPVEALGVRINVEHTYTGDLVVVLENPVGDRVLLLSNRGGSGDDLAFTTFLDNATVPVGSGSAPFDGTYRPEGRLAAFNGGIANGTWQLLIADTADQDGGTLLGWELEVEAAGPAPEPAPPASNSLIAVRFGGGLTPSQREAFSVAAAQWSTVITSRLPAVRLNDGRIVDGIEITASATRIDGPSGILGQAGPEFLRPGTLIPATGVMQFDTGDIAQLEQDDGLVDVIVHEMGHVLGIGTLWAANGLIRGSGSANPVFTGTQASAAFGTLIGEGPTPVPIANTGGPGTREGHWRESVLGNELMTGFLNNGPNPLSALTVASLEDIGYEVNQAAAEAFALPTRLELAMMGVWAEPASQTCCTLGGINRLEPTVLPDTAIVS